MKTCRTMIETCDTFEGSAPRTPRGVSGWIACQTCGKRIRVEAGHAVGSHCDRAGICAGSFRFYGTAHGEAGAAR